MFEELTKFQVIYVSGAQRSGTRIATKMVAHDTGHTYVDETAINVDSLSRLWGFLREHKEKKLVIHCPGLCRWVHHLATGECAVIFVKRSFDEIHASEERINWRYEFVEQMKYGSFESVAEQKLKFWERYQRDIILNSYTVLYESLEGHPLWLPKEQRIDFKYNRTE